MSQPQLDEAWERFVGAWATEATHPAFPGSMQYFDPAACTGSTRST